MSRKSKRRRMRQVQTPGRATGSEPGDGFDFLDDRDPGNRKETPRPALEAAPPATFGSSARLPGVTSTVAAAGVPARAAAAIPTPTPTATATTTAVEPAPASHEPVVGATSAAPPEPPPPPPAAPQPSIGETLSAARQARGLTIEAASARTRIPAKMLAHLENDRFSEFAAEAYARGFLRSYGTFLRLDVAPLLRRFEALHGVRPAPATPEVAAGPVAEPTPVAAPKPVATSLANETAAVVEPPVAAAVRRRRIDLRLSSNAWVAIGVTASVLLVVGGGLLVGRDDRFEVRPTAGLQQIEKELRAAEANSKGTVRPETGTAVPAGDPPPAAVEETSPVQRQATAIPNPATGRTTVVEDASPPAPSLAPGPPASLVAAPVVDKSPRRGPDPVTDLLPEPEPKPPALAAPKSPVATGPLVLVATALDSCALRVQVDSDARRAQRWSFTRRGQSRSWTAKQGFRIVAERGQRLELRLNGRLVPVPADGAAIVLDHAVLAPSPASPAVAPSRPASPPPRRAAAPQRARNKPVPPPATAAATTPQNAAGPP